MKKDYIRYLCITFMSIFLSTCLYATPQGKIIGGTNHEMPSWFKQSFLDIQTDVNEANAAHKQVMLFLDLNGCPYCAKMIKESFVPKNATSDFIKANFDVVNLNIQGDLEVTWDENHTYTEKQLAQKLKVMYTPTILFLDKNEKIVARIDGYRSPENFKDILEYVQGRHYKNMKLANFVNKVKNRTLYKLQDNPMFQHITDLSKITSPLAVIFEDGSCTQCGYFQNNLLKKKDIIAQLKKYTVVRFNADSNALIITPNGEKTTPKKWAEKINLTYRPGILLYNNGKLIRTIDALLYNFHFRELLRYVSGKYYDKYSSFHFYLQARRKTLLSQGAIIDMSDK